MPSEGRWTLESLVVASLVVSAAGFGFSLAAFILVYGRRRR